MRSVSLNALTHMGKEAGLLRLRNVTSNAALCLTLAMISPPYHQPMQTVPIFPQLVTVSLLHIESNMHNGA